MPLARRALAPLIALVLAACGAAPAASTPEAPPAPGSELYVLFADGAEGYMDRDGETVVAPRFELVHPFSDGLGLVYTPDTRRAGFVDPTGAWAIEPRLASAKSFSDGRAAAKDAESGDCGYIDRTGAWVVRPAYVRCQPFSDLRALVELPRRRGRVLDPGGETVFDLPAEADIGDPPQYSEGLMGVELREMVRFYDIHGAVAFEGPWRFTRGFSEGLAPVRGADGWSYVDRTGRVVLSGYAFAGRFHEGLAVVTLPGETKPAVIDRTGEVVIPPRFDRIGPFSEGRANAEVDGKMGYIDRTGAWVVQPIWDDPEASWATFRGGRAMVGRRTADGKLLRGYIDLDGRVVREPSR